MTLSTCTLFNPDIQYESKSVTEKSEINSVSKISAALNGSDGKAMQNMLKNKNDTKNKIVDNQHQQQNYIKTS